MFSWDKGHEIKQCYTLKNEIERLIAKGYVQQFVRRDTRADLDGEESNQPNQVLLEINVILGGISTRGDSGSGKRKYRK
jgi:hypothetical protein